ncbi:hypothetical protein H4R34_000338 [Dimargaris verticillata]|uniref:Membrane insertase YidC/Oxa/ALB C-terminal domain-containing protein n=1 Tax=Dimargaris verticillata TaxID=2761393 RepID=A0A9W8BC16_9FUNG|nr:hypothetical protein H4R34_000338 [Dimargaris verticillata]
MRSQAPSPAHDQAIGVATAVSPLATVPVDGAPATIAVTQSALEGLQAGAWDALPGLPWWGALVVGTVLLRLTILPVAVYQQRAIRRQMALQPVVEAWVATLRENLKSHSLSQGWNLDRYRQEVQRHVRRQIDTLYAQHDCRPIFRMVLPLVQVPLFLNTSFTIRRMCGLPLPWFDATDSVPAVPELSQGGALWFSDLLATDPTYALPVLIGAAHLINIQLNLAANRQVVVPPYFLYLINGFRVLSVGMVYVAAQMPVGVCLYWLTSALFSTCQHMCFRLPAVRRALGFYITKLNGS